MITRKSGAFEETHEEMGSGSRLSQSIVKLFVGLSDALESKCWKDLCTEWKNMGPNIYFGDNGAKGLESVSTCTIHAVIGKNKLNTRW